MSIFHAAIFLKKTAFVSKKLEGAESTGINKEASYATLLSCGSLKETLTVNQHTSSYSRSRDGEWKFKCVDLPQKRRVDKMLLAGIGVRIFPDNDLDQFDYQVRRPMQNYADHRPGVDV